VSSVRDNAAAAVDRRRYDRPRAHLSSRKEPPWSPLRPRLLHGAGAAKNCSVSSRRRRLLHGVRRRRLVSVRPRAASFFRQPHGEQSPRSSFSLPFFIISNVHQNDAAITILLRRDTADALSSKCRNSDSKCRFSASSVTESTLLFSLESEFFHTRTHSTLVSATIYIWATEVQILDRANRTPILFV
jgi:hypothetical protein